MCLYPRLIKNGRYVPNKKNGGNVPVFRDKRVLVVPAACGDCIECRKQKSREVQIRLYEELKATPLHIVPIFITLTFSTESYVELMKECKGLSGFEGYDLDNQIASLAVRRFTERWRKKYKTAIRHWLITELGHGETEHIHLHGLLWIDQDEIFAIAQRGDDRKKAQERLIDKFWKYGRVGAGDYVNRRTVNYLTKYITKVDFEHKAYKPRIYTSKGIGAAYIKSVNAELNKFRDEETREYYRTDTGHKIALPTYYRNKLYSEEEREVLWLNKLDKEVRYVRKMEIDISESEQEYYDALAIARADNEMLGYGNGQTDKARILYEKMRRKYLQNKRAWSVGVDINDLDKGGNTYKDASGGPTGLVVYSGIDDNCNDGAIYELRQRLGDSLGDE